MSARSFVACVLIAAASGPDAYATCDRGCSARGRDCSCCSATPGRCCITCSAACAISSGIRGTASTLATIDLPVVGQRSPSRSRARSPIWGYVAAGRAGGAAHDHAHATQGRAPPRLGQGRRRSFLAAAHDGRGQPRCSPLFAIGLAIVASPAPTTRRSPRRSANPLVGAAAHPLRGARRRSTCASACR